MLAGLALGFTVLAWWSPTAALLIAGWAAISCAAVTLWIGLCLTVRWWQARRFNRHTAQALRVVDE